MHVWNSPKGEFQTDKRRHYEGRSPEVISCLLREIAYRALNALSARSQGCPSTYILHRRMLDITKCET